MEPITEREWDALKEDIKDIKSDIRRIFEKFDGWNKECEEKHIPIRAFMIESSTEKKSTFNMTQMAIQIGMFLITIVAVYVAWRHK